MADLFGVTLRERIIENGPLCVGIDPSEAVLTSWGRPNSVEGLEYAARQILDAVVDVATVVKPQVAFFERFGSAGFRVLERVIADAHEGGVLVVGDAKRGDIGSTNDGYADAWLTDTSPLCVDAVTVHPYLGLAALSPLTQRASATGRGLFVLAATSNPEGRRLQTSRSDDGVAVEDQILEDIARWNEEAEGGGSLGVVLGATRSRPRFDLSRLGGPYLVPGVGAQGADVGDVARLFAGVPRGTVLVSVSRGITDAGPEKNGLRDSARRWRDDLLNALL